MTTDIQRVVRTKTVKHLYDHIPPGAIATAVAGALLLISLVVGLLPAPRFGLLPYFLWYGAVLLIVGIRLWMYYEFRRGEAGNEKPASSLFQFRVFAGLAGLSWGAVGAISGYAPIDTFTVTLLIIGAMCAGAIPYLAADLRSYMVFLVGGLLPVLASQLAIQPESMYLYLSLFAVYGVGIGISGQKYENMFTTSLHLRISADRLTAKIAETNRQLEDELKHRKQVTEQLEQARNQAEAANRAKTQFLSRMSHELRTPLNAVLGFSELLTIMPLQELSQKRADYLGKISASGSHLLSLIEDILDITRIDTGQLRLSKQQIHISEMLNECVSMLEPKAAEHSVAVRLDPNVDPTLTIATDRLRFRQVLLNLVSNAIKYNKPSGRVDIGVQRIADQVQIRVTDTGIGIAAEDLGKAFEPFARLRNETGTIEGTGIGLTITKQLTEMMQGSIDIQSAINEGTTVTVAFPIDLDSAAQLQPTGT